MTFQHRFLSVIALCLCAVPVFAQETPNLARSLSAAVGAQAHVLWVDGTANLFRNVVVNGVDTPQNFTTTRAGVAEIVRKSKAAHINTLVVDVKPLGGEVLYNSKIAPHLRVWQGHPIPDFDVLAAFIAEGHAAGIRIDAAVNILSEGHKYYSTGPAYAHPDWQSVVYTIDRGLVAPDGKRLAIHIPNEPDDAQEPTLLDSESTILGGDPTARVGLDNSDSTIGLLSDPTLALPDQQTNVLLDASNRVEGIVDSALLGDDPLIASEGGHLLTATREEDQNWIAAHLKPNTPVRFDYRDERIPIAQAPSEKVACFVNPLNPAVRKYELDIVREILTRYDVDGIVLDRCRHSNIYNDFSDRTRLAFVDWLQRQPQIHDRLLHFPQDIFSFSPRPGEGMVTGALYKPWLEFRAQVIRDFAADVAHVVRTTKPHATLGTYVGAWYPSYYEVGVNWGSEHTRLRYPWQTETYPRTGYAEFFDWITTGCYQPIALREDARREGLNEHGSVEFLAEQSTQAVANGAFVYPGVYIPDYETHPDILLRALEAANRHGQGWMLFDLSQIEEFHFWGVLERAATQDTVPPHALPDLLPAVRAARSGAQ